MVAALPTNLEHDLLYCLPCMCRTAFLDCSFLDLFNAKLSWEVLAGTNIPGCFRDGLVGGGGEGEHYT